ncbi:hypothetical protein B0T24DRAFT_151450 [Lasiosphaeria ovina]|uniref:Uncharacterized protein n=1 Tax=Lasiosphaeria ovina TaxID=92902 RepID=A0AAE0KMS3_9PEZI|nr:hypothetical protein B0T24DRAFT_151450 [Lasiosphaeria ovina]
MAFTSTSREVVPISIFLDYVPDTLFDILQFATDGVAVTSFVFLYSLFISLFSGLFYFCTRYGCDLGGIEQQGVIGLGLCFGGSWLRWPGRAHFNYKIGNLSLFSPGLYTPCACRYLSTNESTLSTVHVSSCTGCGTGRWRHARPGSSLAALCDLSGLVRPGVCRYLASPRSRCRFVARGSEAATSKVMKVAVGCAVFHSFPPSVLPFLFSLSPSVSVCLPTRSQRKWEALNQLSLVPQKGNSNLTGFVYSFRWRLGPSASLLAAPGIDLS